MRQFAQCLTAYEQAESMARVMREEVIAFKRETILEAAAVHFYEKGYDGTRVDSIASHLGVTKPYIYYHFANKTEILDEICTRVTLFSVEALQAAVAAEPQIEAQLKRAIGDLVEWALDHQAWIAIYFREEKYISEAARKMIAADRRTYDRLLNDLLHNAAEAGLIHVHDLRIATQALTGMITWPFTWYRKGGRLSRDDLSDSMVQLAMNMLGYRPAD